MKTSLKDYVGLSEEDKRYLKEFNNAFEKGFFKDELIKLPKEVKEEIVRQRNKFKSDLMFIGRRKGNVDDMTFKEKVHVGRKKVKSPRDGDGKFKRKEHENK